MRGQQVTATLVVIIITAIVVISAEHRPAPVSPKTSPHTITATTQTAAPVKSTATATKVAATHAVTRSVKRLEPVTDTKTSTEGDWKPILTALTIVSIIGVVCLLIYFVVWHNPDFWTRHHGWS